MSEKLREIVNKKLIKSVSKKIEPDFIDKEEIDNTTNKILNSYIKYQNKRINRYHKNEVEIIDNIDYHEKVVLFD